MTTRDHRQELDMYDRTSRIAAALAWIVLGLAAPSTAQGVWTATSTLETNGSTLSGRTDHTAVWTGAKMIIWGGGLGPGAVYDPVADAWTRTSNPGSLADSGNTAVWTGSRMIVWGGGNGVNLGSLYDPATDTWTPMTTMGSPSGRYRHTAVWTGSRMIVWGGNNGASALNTGGSYDPTTNTWAPLSTAGAPSARYWHVAAWTGARMIVWGGAGSSILDTPNSGGSYDPATDSWSATATTGAPLGRISATAVWTGTRMIVWGGGGYESSGGVYDPVADAWTATSQAGVPSGRTYHASIWTGTKMVVWGGAGQALVTTNTGGSYDPVTNAWAPTATSGAPGPRFGHTAVWTGWSMIVWGGRESGSTLVVTNTGGSYGEASLLPPPRSFFSLTPCRLADTRLAPGPSGGPALAANTRREFPVSGSCGVPSGATAVAINVTVVDETDGGDLRIYPAGSAPPLASTINFAPGKVRANNAVIPLGPGGQIGVQCDMAPGSMGRTQFVLDVTGYFE